MTPAASSPPAAGPRGKTTSHSGKPSNTDSSPIIAGNPPAGTSPGQQYGAPRDDHIHAGLDIPVSYGTDCFAPLDGKVTYASTSGFDGGGMIHFEFQNDFGMFKKGDVIGWGHASATSVSAGTSVRQGEKVGESGAGSGGDCVHFIYQPGGGGSIDGTADPTKAYEALRKGTGGTSTGPGGSSSAGGAGSFSEEDIFAIGRAAAISTQLELPGLLNYEAAMLLTGSKSIYNDEPLLPFVQELAKASLRHFQSLPDGKFFAFYPDQFGTYNHRKPYWLIDDIEIVDGSIELNDEALATHVFVVGDTTNPDGQISVPEMIASTGVVTVFDAFASNFMIQKDERRKNAKPGTRKILDRGAAMSFLRRYGVRPHYEPAPFIRNHMFEMYYAFTQFQLLWSRQFLTQFSFTFMPELYPGGVVAFPDHGVRCYIDAVTHTFDYTGGFTTQANLSAPAAYGPDATDVSQGMVKPLTNKEFKQITETTNGGKN